MLETLDFMQVSSTFEQSVSRIQVLINVSFFLIIRDLFNNNRILKFKN